MCWNYALRKIILKVSCPSKNYSALKFQYFIGCQSTEKSEEYFINLYYFYEYLAADKYRNFKDAAKVSYNFS